MTRITTELDAELYQRLRVKLAKDGLKSAAVMRLAIADYVAGKWTPVIKPTRQPRKPKGGAE